MRATCACCTTTARSTCGPTASKTSRASPFPEPMNRRISRQVLVEDVRIGGGAPVVVQSMTNTDTEDAESTARQVEIGRASCRERVEIWVVAGSGRRKQASETVDAT